MDVYSANVIYVFNCHCHREIVIPLFAYHTFKLCLRLQVWSLFYKYVRCDLNGVPTCGLQIDVMCRPRFREGITWSWCVLMFGLNWSREGEVFEREKLTRVIHLGYEIHLQTYITGVLFVSRVIADGTFLNILMKITWKGLHLDKARSWKLYNVHTCLNHTQCFFGGAASGIFRATLNLYRQYPIVTNQSVISGCVVLYSRRSERKLDTTPLLKRTRLTTHDAYTFRVVCIIGRIHI
jgi:hypothetical protein